MPVSQWFDASVFAVLGLLVGSFLNVVIYRLPRMLEAQWQAECAELSARQAPAAEPFNLMLPRSHCPKCKHQIAWYDRPQRRVRPRQAHATPGRR